MNRRSFLSTISAIVAAPSLVRAEPPPLTLPTNAQNEPPLVVEREQCSYCSEWFDAPVGLHHTEQECALNRLTEVTNEIHRQQSAGPSFVGMTPEQFVEEIKGAFPIALRSMRQQGGNSIFEFDVLAPCTFAPPPWLNLGEGFPRYVSFGEILTIYVHAERQDLAALIQSSPL